MHSEHLSNVRPGTVALAWFVAAAVSALVVFALIAVGLLPPDGIGGEGWGLLATAAGFFAGGWFAGWRAGGAPILHAVAMGLFSLVLWVLLNLFPGAALRAESWDAGTAYVAGLVLLQIVAAAVGGRMGSREARAAAAPGGRS
ncbi:MAG TPA: hypothetical protein VGO40_05100 [Longimicrobium sp.]|jgi:hypothetical protein|nr:hypothetical protein [Longimicrobium sp.]